MTIIKGSINTLGIYVVGRVLIKQKGKYLLLKRNDRDSYGGLWELPGGKLDTLEEIKTSVIREIFEETDLIIKIETNNVHVSSNIAKEGKHVGSTYINFIYSDGEITAGKLKIKNEHQAHGWFTQKEIFNLDLAYYIRMPLTDIFLSL